jgi:hypothetical protein
MTTALIRKKGSGCRQAEKSPFEDTRRSSAMSQGEMCKETNPVNSWISDYPHPEL